jgi:hypothetical protein
MYTSLSVVADDDFAVVSFGREKAHFDGKTTDKYMINGLSQLCVNHHHVTTLDLESANHFL